MAVAKKVRGSATCALITTAAGVVPRARRAGISYATLTRAVGYKDRDAISEAVATYMKFGRALTPRLERQLQRFFDDLQATKEVTLYSYGPWVVSGLFQLRELENRAKARISAEVEIEGFSADDAVRIFISETTKMVGRGADSVLQSLARLESVHSRSSKEVNLDCDYSSASTLMALAAFWLEVRTALHRKKISLKQFNSLHDLDFSHLELSVESISDVLKMAYRLYDRVGAHLRQIGQLSTDAEIKARILTAEAAKAAESANAAGAAATVNDDIVDRARALAADAADAAAEARAHASKTLAAKDDSQIASQNMLGIQSLAMELKGIAQEEGFESEIDFEEAPFIGIDREELERAAELIQGCYQEHMLICRNLLYMAVQVGDVLLADKLTNHIAAVLKRSRKQVWSMRIWGRTPLREELPLKAYKP